MWHDLEEILGEKLSRRVSVTKHTKKSHKMIAMARLKRFPVEL
jgi:hypothetical protein